MNQSSRHTIGIVLAGGAGKRMNGVDKGLLEYRGQPLVEHVIQRLVPQTDGVIICANRNHTTYERFGFPVLADLDQTYQGPIAGIVSALEYLQSTVRQHSQPTVTRALVVTCDTPNIPMTLGNRLAAEVSTDNPVAVVHDGQRTQNLHCLIHQSAWSSLRSFYASGGRAMHRWHTQVNSVPIDFGAQAGCFKNVNELTQLEH